MVYCPKCGKQNADDALYCNSCGASLTTGRKDANKECDDTCSGRSRSGHIFWGIIVILVGIWVIFEFGIKNISGLPEWVDTIEWGWIFGLVIGVAILIGGISLIMRANKR